MTLTPACQPPRKECPYWKRNKSDNHGFKHCQNQAITATHTNPPAPGPNPFSVITDEGFEGVVKAIQEQAVKAARERVLGEPRDCATCNNNQNAIKYVRIIQSCTAMVAKKRRMDDLKESCQHCRSMGKFTFDENKCRGYQGHCEQSYCSRFNWWHAKCNCRIIREYDEQKESLRAQQEQP